MRDARRDAAAVPAVDPTLDPSLDAATWDERDVALDADPASDLGADADRRAWKRTPVVRLVEYSPFPRRDATQRLAVGFTANESRGGLCMLTRKVHAVGEPLRICVREIGGEPRLEAIARVAWCSDDVGGRVAVGLEFVEVRARRAPAH